MFCIEDASDIRTKPTAPNPEPGTTATLPASTSQSRSATSSANYLPSIVVLPTYADTSGNA